MIVLVTGGAGFIGSHLCETLLDDGHKVICLDNFCDFYPSEIKRANIKHVQSSSNFILYEGDVRDQPLLDKIYTHHKVDVTVHLAAMAGVRPSIENPDLYYDVNINGTINVLQACRRHGASRIVFASSSSVYGNNKVPFREVDTVDQPISPYASTKKSGELACYTWHHLFHLSIICLRFFTVYGPRQRPDLAIHKFTGSIMRNKAIDIYGDGSSSRDYTFISDIIHGIMASIRILRDCRHPLYRVYNLGNSEPITLIKMIRAIEKELGMQAVLNHMASQPGDVNVTYADISSAKKDLSYDPEVTFQEGIRGFVRWFTQNISTPR